MKGLFAWLPGLVFCVFCLSCGGNSGPAAEPVDKAAVDGTALSGAAVEGRAVPAVPAEGEDSERRMILEKGNFWISGIPGFGKNALPALSGTYRITPAVSPDKARVFAVWLCREALFYDDWDIRAGSWPENYRVMEKRGGNGLLLAVPFNETWTGIFGFPDNSDFSQSDIDKIAGIYGSRFLYFLSMSRSNSDISMPAQVEF